LSDGVVGNGNIYQHEFVADTVISGLIRVQLLTEVQAVLTPQNFHEHDDHKKFFYDHFVVQGVEADTARGAAVAVPSCSFARSASPTAAPSRSN
jgi:6,7-dimethyl-8-ribityllumazine synthase